MSGEVLRIWGVVGNGENLIRIYCMRKTILKKEKNKKVLFE